MMARDTTIGDDEYKNIKITIKRSGKSSPTRISYCHMINNKLNGDDYTFEA